MKEKILNFFGLTTLKEQAVTVNYLIKREEEIVNECAAKLLEYKKMFNWDFYANTLMSWNDWKIKNNIKDTMFFDSKQHTKYYNEIMLLEHQAYKIRTISKYPKFLNAFLLELSNYDFNKDSEFFKEIDFKYSSVDAMTVDVLIDTVITLLPQDFEGTNEIVQGISSGGYEVCFYYEKDNPEPKCKIEFDKELFYD